MRKNWKKLRKNIPNKLHVGYGKQYEVFWQDGLKPGSDGKRVYGETRFEPNQIILDSNQSDKEAVMTVVHEAYHALSAEHDINLTETQVILLEKCFPYIHEFILTLEGIKR